MSNKRQKPYSALIDNEKGLYDSILCKYGIQNTVKGRITLTDFLFLTAVKHANIENKVSLMFNAMYFGYSDKV